MINWNELFLYMDGELYWKIRGPGRFLNKPAGALTNNGYKAIRFNYKRYLNHRIIWEMHNEEIPTGLIIDHKDGNKLNNNISNLRLATLSQNQGNSKKQRNNTCGYKGVIKCRNKFQAQIRFNNKKYHLGVFGTPYEAHLAYIAKAKEFFGEFYKGE